MGVKYPLPECLKKLCKQSDYTRWIQNKATAHFKRDVKRGNKAATKALYREAIHQAVCNGGHVDAYTGRALRWDLIHSYRNEASKSGKRGYKKSFADLPTLDHEEDGLGAPKFRICSWRTNDCKNDLTIEELVAFCTEFLGYQRPSSAKD